MILFDLKSLGHLTTGSLIERENRFLATAIVHGQIQKVHIADTGRLEEILTPQRELLLLENRPGLKTDYTLVAAKMEEGWVLINTKLHSTIAKKAIEAGLLGFRPKKVQTEVRFGKSRIDFMADNMLIELKGCSLVENNICLFPNAPTTRGARHIEELMAAKEQGFEAAILIMAVRPCACFRAHPTRDEAFRTIFQKALQKGVRFFGFFIQIDTNFTIRYAGNLQLC